MRRKSSINEQEFEHKSYDDTSVSDFETENMPYDEVNIDPCMISMDSKL